MGNTGKNVTLADITTLLEDDNQNEDALKQLDTLLEEQPNNQEARLLKAELSLKENTNLAFVGEVAAELSDLAERDERQQAFLSRVQAACREFMQKAQRDLRSSYGLSPAVGYFKEARHLLPRDPGLALAQAALLVKHREANGHSAQCDRLIEQALRDSLSLSQSGDRTRTAAAGMLAELLENSGRFQEALELLEEVLPDGGDLAGQMAATHARCSAALVGEAVGLIRQLMRLGEQAAAGHLLEGCLLAMPGSPEVWAAVADWLLLAGRPEAALPALCYAARTAQQVEGQVIDRQALARVKQEAEALLRCPFCQSQVEEDDTNCPICCTKLRQQKLMADRWELGKLSTTAATAASLGLLLAEQNGPPEEALHWLEQARALLPEDHSLRGQIAGLEETLHEQVAGRQRAARLSEALHLLEAGRADDARLVLAALADDPQAGERAQVWLALSLGEGARREEVDRTRLVRAASVSPDVWHALPLTARCRLVGTLLVAGWLVEAGQLIPVIYADTETHDRRVQALLRRYTVRVQKACKDLAARSAAALAAGETDCALALAREARVLDGLHPAATLAEAQALLAAGSVFEAAAGFRLLLDREENAGLRAEAALGLARVCEALDDLPEAQRALDRAGQETPSIQEMRARLERRLQQVPAVLVWQPGGVVLADTLRYEADENAPFQAVFCIEVAAAARWQPDRRRTLDWVSLADAGLSFVSALSGLAGVFQSPAFELRFIGEPDLRSPLRTRVRIGLLCRVAHSDPDGARRLALDLWAMLSRHLPRANEFIYRYEAVHDEEALRRWLDPFEVQDSAEIVRRASAQGAGYIVQPFTTGGKPLEGLVELLRAQPVPALVSVHLQPVTLLPWEQAALEDNVVRLRQLDVVDDSARMPDESAAPLSGVLLPDPHAVRMIETSAMLRDALTQDAAYLLRVSVASSRADDALLPHSVAAEIFGAGGAAAVLRPEDGAAQTALRRSLRELTIERWQQEDNPPAGLERLRYLVTGAEAGLTFRLPMPGVEGIPGVPTIDIKAVPPLALPAEGVRLGETVALFNGHPQQALISPQDRRRHVYVLGKTGVGKSTLLLSMVLQDIQTGRGVAVLDPHGDLVDDLLVRIPPERAGDVVLFDPADEERPVGLNILQAETDSQRDRIVTEFIEMLIRMYDPKQNGIAGPLFQHVVRMGMLTAMLGLEKPTLIEVMRVLTDMKYAKSLLPRISDPLIRHFWLFEAQNWGDKYLGEIRSWVVSKFNRFIGDRRMRMIIGQRDTTLDFPQVLSGRKILLVKLSKGLIGEESAAFLGMLVQQSLLNAVLARAETPAAHREDFCLYVDEFQSFATESFRAMLSEGRKYGLCLVMANQYLDQLPDYLQRAVFGNVGTLLTFQVGAQDAFRLASEYYPVYGLDDLINVPRYTAAVRLLVDGVTTRPFALRTRLVSTMPDVGLAARICEASRMQYGRPAREVEREVNARFEEAEQAAESPSLAWAA